ncbi:MAG TPA: 3-deoxy-D-manno-octulosonic acid transferase [Terriglobales bacterium]|nr:3-deoxy-D-manno-octulosonic acid transferase [Terriglobales bacterium]
MYFFYTLGLWLWLLVGAPVWLWQMRRHGKHRASLRARLGKVPEHLSRRSGPVIWVHAVSVGEVLAVSVLVQQLRQRYPGARVVVSTVTDTGQKLARQRFGAENVFYFPLDFGFAIRPYLRALQPALIVIAETEFWPNFLRLSHAGGARIAVVNARISDRSLPGYRRVRRWLARVLQNIDLLLAQTEQDRQRLLAIGAVPDRVQVAGNLKFDAPRPASPPVVQQLRAAMEAAEAGPVIVAGSTVEGEEPLLLRALETVLSRHARAVLILAPRHPERFNHVAAMISDLGIRFWRRSEWKASRSIAGGVFLLDSIGELASLYELATVAFVGGSLVERGGHNILEAAQCGVPVVVGPHTENFRDIVNLFRDAGAVRVVGPAELPLVLAELVENAEERARMGQRALETLNAHRGATERTMRALEALASGTALDGAAEPNGASAQALGGPGSAARKI